MSSVVEVLPSSDDEEVYVSSSPQQPAQPADPQSNDAAATSSPKQNEATGDGAPTIGGPESGDASVAVVDVSEGEDDADEASEYAVDVEECTRLKNAGNALFVKNDVTGALKQYRRAMRFAPIKPHAAALPPSELDAKEGGESQSRGPSPHDDATEADAAAPPPASAPASSAEPDVDTTDYTVTAQVYCNAGLCLMKLQLLDEAVENLSEAIRHDGAYQKAYLRRAECYYELNKWSSAFADYDSYSKLGGQLDAGGRAKMADSKTKMEAEMQKMLGDLKDVGNKFLGLFGLSTDNFKFDKDPTSGGYSMRFER